MPNHTRIRYERWGLPELLDRYADLRIMPSYWSGLTLAGNLAFRVEGPASRTIEDTYSVRIRVPTDFPQSLPSTWETASRIPHRYHKLEDRSLCLAAPTAIRIELNRDSTLPHYVEHFVIPYLYGYSHFEKFGVAPYGELSHGRVGLLEHVASLFNSLSFAGSQDFLRLASLSTRVANRCRCPCQSGKRLGDCHYRAVNHFRSRFGRQWCEEEYFRLQVALTPPSSSAPLSDRLIAPSTGASATSFLDRFCITSTLTPTD